MPKKVKTHLLVHCCSFAHLTRCFVLRGSGLPQFSPSGGRASSLPQVVQRAVQGATGAMRSRRIADIRAEYIAWAERSAYRSHRNFTDNILFTIPPYPSSYDTSDPILNPQKGISNREFPKSDNSAMAAPSMMAAPLAPHAHVRPAHWPRPVPLPLTALARRYADR